MVIFINNITINLDDLKGFIKIVHLKYNIHNFQKALRMKEIFSPFNVIKININIKNMFNLN